MSMKTDKIHKVTSELSEEMLVGQLSIDPDVPYRPVPCATADPAVQPIWRIRFDLTFDSHIRIGLDVNGETVLGRGPDASDFVGLFDADDAEQLGVSRRHAMLRPTESKLYIIDLGSTNGTWLNGRSIGVNMPYSLSNGDILRFGRLEVNVQIIRRPGHTTLLNAKSEAEMLASIARAITSQLDLKEVLKQVVETAMTYTPADEVSVWLVDEQTGELFLEIGKGTNKNQITRLPVHDTLAGKVITTGKPLRASSLGDGLPVKLKTNYLVEAVLYVPLTLGGVTFGVVSAAHQEQGKSFSAQDEKMLTAIAELSAVAVQNARLYQASEHALALRTRLVTALNYALSHELKNLLKSIIGYAGLLEGCNPLDEEMAEIAGKITETGNQLAHLFNRLVEVTTPSEDLFIHRGPCDLVEAVTQALDELYGAASDKSITLDFQLTGDPYLIQGDAAHLYRSLFNLIDNAIRYSPVGAQVRVSLLFWDNDIIIRVQDTGPGIPEADIPHLFDRYYRGRQSRDGQSGLGLGLELVRATVEAHRGTITARNAEDRGAEFIITLPNTLRIA
jgi:signal transduction histidine kinase/pSer/pThr/pTyr-binding forkhead associated (FHA) protein